MALTKASRGMVATSQRLATAVGVELLQRGGSAVDAAIGANAMLSLIEPAMCGPGGDLFALVWDPASKRLHGLNASGRSPRGQSLEMLVERLGSAPSIATLGVHSITVPGAVRGWQALHERFGRLSLAAIFAPVIEHAAAGVAIGPATARTWAHAAQAIVNEASLGTLAAGFRHTFLAAGAAPAAGATFRNPYLGRTYQLLVDDGFDSFYEGALAARLGECLAASGSMLTTADLAAAHADWVTPITTTYRGHEVCELPPNGQGLTVLQMLNILECFPVARAGRDSAEYWHWLIEAKKLAFEDRARFYADPDCVDVPVAALAHKAYAAARAATIGERANDRPRHGDPAIARGDTTYLAAADGDGLMVSLIQSIFSGFGSGVVPDGLGFALQSRGAGFSLDPAHPNAYAPGKRPFHTIIPGFVMKDGEPWMSFGVMGADMQPQGQVQVLNNMIDFGMDAHAAGAAPRMRHDGINAPNLTRAPDGGVIWYEAGFADALVDELRRRGHDVHAATHAVTHFMGGYQCIQRGAGGGYVGASETRFDGCAAGY